MSGVEDAQRIPKGIKFDDGKLPIFTGCLANFPNAMEAISACSAQGQIKYPAFDNWKRVDDPVNRYLNAAVRHLVRRGSGEILDQDTRFDHYWHALWNLCAVVELTAKQEHDRYEQTRPEGQATSPEEKPYCLGPSQPEVQAEDYPRRTEEVWR